MGLVESDRALGAGVLTIAGAIFVTFAVYKIPPWPPYGWGYAWRLSIHVAEILVPASAVVFAGLAVSDAILVAGAYEQQTDETLIRMLARLRLAIVLTILHFFLRLVNSLLEAVSLEDRQPSIAQPPRQEPKRPTGPRIAGHRRKNSSGS